MMAGSWGQLIEPRAKEPRPREGAEAFSGWRSTRDRFDLPRVVGKMNQRRQGQMMTARICGHVIHVPPEDHAAGPQHPVELASDRHAELELGIEENTTNCVTRSKLVGIRQRHPCAQRDGEVRRQVTRFVDGDRIEVDAGEILGTGPQIEELAQVAPATTTEIQHFASGETQPAVGVQPPAHHLQLPYPPLGLGGHGGPTRFP